MGDYRYFLHPKSSTVFITPFCPAGIYSAARLTPVSNAFCYCSGKTVSRLIFLSSALNIVQLNWL